MGDRGRGHVSAPGTAGRRVLTGWGTIGSKDCGPPQVAASHGVRGIAATRLQRPSPAPERPVSWTTGRFACLPASPASTVAVTDGGYVTAFRFSIRKAVLRSRRVCVVTGPAPAAYNGYMLALLASLLSAGCSARGPVAAAHSHVAIVSRPTARKGSRPGEHRHAWERASAGTSASEGCKRLSTPVKPRQKGGVLRVGVSTVGTQRPS